MMAASESVRVPMVTVAVKESVKESVRVPMVVVCRFSKKKIT